MAKRAVQPEPAKVLVCAYGLPWLAHFQPPIGTGLGCLWCQTPQEAPR